MKILIILLSPLFFSPLDFEKFQFPPDFVEFKNPVPPPLHKGGKGEGGGVTRCGSVLVYETGCIFEYISWTTTHEVTKLSLLINISNGNNSWSYYIVILIKSWRSLELVSSLQHSAKNMLEMFVLLHTSIWPNFIFIVLRIQKK